MSLKLHHLNASRSQRIVWLLAELGVDHEIIAYKRDPDTNLAPPELLKIHPMGKSPLLEDGDVVVAETGAITEYLMGRYDTDFSLHPRPSSPEFPRYLEWIHAAEGAVFLPGLFRFYLMNSGLLETPLAGAMEAEQAKAMKTIEAHLSKYDYFAGDRFTAADCVMGFQIQSAAAQGALDSLPATRAWLDRVQARPAYQKMLEVGV
ncbi:MAG: glutathione S-transferase family protein [Hyphomonas sp.]|nr:glutathione S-transferase family protein [Hyphomonas sp.]